MLLTIDNLLSSDCQSYKAKCPFMPFVALLFQSKKNFFNFAGNYTTQFIEGEVCIFKLP